MYHRTGDVQLALHGVSRVLQSQRVDLGDDQVFRKVLGAHVDDGAVRLALTAGGERQRHAQKKSYGQDHGNGFLHVNRSFIRFCVSWYFSQ